MGIGSMMSRLFIGGVAGLITFIVIFYTWVPMNNAIDGLSLFFGDRCELNGERFVRSYAQANDEIVSGAFGAVTKTSASTTTCSFATISYASATATGNKVLSEHGELVVSAAAGTANTSITGAAIASSEWKTPISVLIPYGDISMLILSVLPIMNTVGFLGVNIFSIVLFVRGGGAGVAGHILGSIAILILIILLVNLAPGFLDGLEGVYETVDGRLSVMKRFMNVIQIILEFVPVIFLLGMMGIFGGQGALLGYQQGYVGRGSRSRSGSAMAGLGGM